MFYLGIDVSKAKIDCCLLQQTDMDKKKTKSFANSLTGFESLSQWLIKQCVDIPNTVAVMEATSVYHENIAEYLYQNDIRVCIANPARVRHFAQGLSMLKKTDKADSIVLAHYAAKATLRFWQPEPSNIKLLRELLDRRNVMMTNLQREHNRLEKVESTKTSPELLKLLDESICHYEQQIQKIDEMINDHIDQNPDLKKDLDLLKSIPSIGPRAGLQMLSLFQSHRFEKASQAAAFVGLTPTQHESGSSVHHRSRLSKAGQSNVRSALYMSALTAIKHNPHIAEMYNRLCANGKSKMAALCAAMRKLVHICYGVLKHQSPYQTDHLVVQKA